MRGIRALLDRVRAARQPIEIDGGIDLETVAGVVGAGAGILVAGSAIFHAPDPEQATRGAQGRGRAGRRAAPPPHAPDVRAWLHPDSAPTNRRPVFASATPKPTRWAWSTTRTTSSGSRSGAASAARPRAGPTRDGSRRHVLPVIEAHCEYQAAGALRRRARHPHAGRRCLAGPGAVRLRSAARPGAELARRRRVHGARRGRSAGPAVPAAGSREEPVRMNALVTGVAGFIGSTLADRLLAQGAERHRHRLLHRLLPAAAQGGEPRAASAARPRFRFVEIDDPGRRPRARCSPTPPTSSTWPPRPASARAGAATSGSTPSTTSRRRRCCSRRASASRIERLVYASSSSVYGDEAELPMREDALPQPLSPYGVTKLAAEQLCYLYHVNYGVPTVSLRYFTVYGPRQRPDMGFHRFLRAALAGRADRASTATASRRATSPSSPTPWRRRSPPARAASPGACTISAAGRASR